MFNKEDIKRLEQKIDDIAEALKTLIERQNFQYTDIMLQVKNDPVEKRTDDEMYEEALEAVLEDRVASTSYIQRRLQIGYTRACRLMEMLEKKGVIGPGDGSKPREILIKEE